jgi:hypothetical protein
MDILKTTLRNGIFCAIRFNKQTGVRKSMGLSTDALDSIINIKKQRKCDAYTTNTYY